MIITRVWRHQPGRYFCLSTKSATGDWKDHFFSRNQFKDIPEFLRHHHDKDIYFCPHGFTKRHRLKPNAVMPQLLWSDLDEADPRTMSLRPTIAIESSPGRFVGLWVVDEEVTESLNRRLAYSIGADISGWDLTQVLRVPNTLNYKYQSTPRVKLMWSNGPSYTLAKLESLLPETEDTLTDPESESDASSVFKRYEKKIPRWCRKELISGKPTAGKRSEMIWKIENALLEAGLTTDEAFLLVKASPWNKFKGRRNEDEQLKRELDKVINKTFQAAKPVDDGDEDGDYRYLSRSLADVEEENMDWIWYGRLARGELTILEGDPGLGKSYLAQMVAGAIIDGLELPSTKKSPTVQGRVAYFDIENSSGSVTKKRMVSNGFKNLRDFYQEEEPFSVDDDEELEFVYDAIEELRPMLVVFDTINTYIGKADTHKSSETQQAFGRFRDIAKRFNCAVLVLRHLTKSTKERALYRGQGSIAFAGLARVVMTVGIDPEDPDVRILAVTKINVTRPPKSIAFSIHELPDTIKDQDRSKFEWGGFVDLTADEILSGPSEGSKNKGPSETEQAKEFLLDALNEGPVDAGRIHKMADARSISHQVLRRAADELGVVKSSKGFGSRKRSRWSLAGDED